jgi:hypothetical protein
MSKTIGKRPKPSVPGPSSQFNTNSMGGYKGKSGSKSPTGSRPRPTVPMDHPSGPPPMVASKRAVKHTSMPSPNRKSHTGAGKKTGGGGY